MNKEINPLASILSKTDPYVCFDIDGTLKLPGSDYQGKFNENVVSVLLGLQELANTGACTDQSPFELAAFLSEMAVFNQSEKQILVGPSVLEGGHVLVPAGGMVDKDFQVLTSFEAQIEMKQIKDEFQAVWQPLGKGEWGLIPEVATPVVMVSSEYQGLGSVSVWEKGSNTHDSDYQGEYEPVMSWFQTKAKELGLERLSFVEVGNGTLRVIEKGKSKANLLADLHESGVINLAASIYFGDGKNDVEPGKLVQSYGGVLVAVANACPELIKRADVVTDRMASSGVIDVLEKVI